jgi:hypothetical protein
LAEAKTVGTPAEIRIAQGVYTPDRSSASPGGTGDRLVTFPLLNDVALRGGFAGIAVLDPRDLDAEPTRADDTRVLINAGPCSRPVVLG